MGRFSISSRKRTCLAVLLVACISGTARAADGDEAAKVLDDVLGAWKERESRVRTARFAWNETCYISAGARMPRHSGASIVLLPAADVTFDRSATLVLSGHLLRYSREGPVWDDFLGELVNRSHVSTFDGENSRSFYSDDEMVPRRFKPVGFDNNEARNLQSNYYMLAPVLLTFRAGSSDVGGRDFGALTLSSKTATVDGRPCAIVARDDKKANLVEEFWVDTHRDYLIVRVERSLPGKVTSLEVSYQNDTTHGWVPSAWKWSATGPQSGRVFEQATATVTHYEINADIPQEEFRFDFPPGTVVRDMRREKDYIQLQGDDKRIITREEIARGATYEEFLRTESGKAGLLRRPFFSTRTLLGAAVVLAIAIVVVIATKAWRQRRSP
jgi:hypothetical protein